MFGPFPVRSQAFERSSQALVGDRHGDDASLEADLGGQFQGPGAALFAKIAGTAMEPLFQSLGKKGEGTIAIPEKQRRR